MMKFSDLPKLQITNASILSDLIYSVSPLKPSTEEDIKREIRTVDFKYLSLEATDTQAIIATTEDSIYVAFRGSESPLDWALNLFADMRPHLQGHSHTGFKHAAERSFSEVAQELHRQRQLYPNKILVLCGHSLGGAMAVFTALLLKEKYPEIKIDYLVTFGQPRTGNKNFVSCVRDFNFPYLRFKNEGDCVPDVPPPSGKSDWSHCGDLILFRKNGVAESLEEEDEAAVYGRIGSLLTGAIQLIQSKADKSKILEFAAGPHSMKLYRARIEAEFLKSEQQG